MRIPSGTCLFVLSLCLLTIGQATEAEHISDWISENAAPLSTVYIHDDVSDLKQLKDIVGNARLIALGEGTHDAHELWAFRNRLFAYLVENMGVTAIAAETGLTQAYVTDAYVQGESVDPTKAARGVFSWSNSIFAENRELVEWMRAYNTRAATKRKLRFYGLEMTGCMDADGRPLLEGALDYIETTDLVRAQTLRKAFAPTLQRFNRQNARLLTNREWQSLVVASQDLVSLFERRQVVWTSKSGVDAFQRAYRQAIAVRQLTAHFRMGGEGRDIAAAENLRWALEQQAPDGRLFVFAHNSHVAKWRIAPKNNDDLHSTMGELVADYLGDDLFVIGSLYDNGEARDLLGLFRPVNKVYKVQPAKAGSLNDVASSTSLPMFLLDLERAKRSPATKSWFSELREIRNLNVRAGYHQVNTLAAFDALFFVRNLTPLRLMWAPEPATNAKACFVDSLSQLNRPGAETRDRQSSRTDRSASLSSEASVPGLESEWQDDAQGTRTRPLAWAPK